MSILETQFHQHFISNGFTMLQQTRPTIGPQQIISADEKIWIIAELNTKYIIYPPPPPPRHHHNNHIFI